MKKEEQRRDVIVYRGTAVPAIDVMVDGETVWLTLGQMARLFGRDMSVIGKHVKNVFAEGELPEEGYRQILPKNGKGRPETIFALDVIISVGYRVKSKEGVLFRQWATKCLREIMLGRLRRELMNEKTNRRIDAVENRLTRVENGLADGRIFVSLPHGIDLSFPISGNWRLEDATPEQRNHMELDEEGIHWPAIDEDLSYEGLLMGDYGQFVRRPAALQSV